ncbi:MAG: DUF4416 family protein [Pseudomonadota bacterium]
MGSVRTAPQGLLFTAVTVTDVDLLKSVSDQLTKAHGPLFDQMPPFCFSEMTKYYEEEMGPALWKTFFIFRDPIGLEHIYEHKVESNLLEDSYSKNGRRQANIDPGYLTLFNFCLLTTKGFSHRVYLGKGIYTEVTLLAKEKRFQPLPWTYSDYKTKQALDFLEAGRQFLKNEVFGNAR